MSSTRLYWFSGIGLLLGGLFALIGTLVQGVNANPLGSAWVPTTVLVVIGEMLILAGLPGMYARQASQAGTLGLVGFILFFFSGLMQGVGGGVINLFFLPWLLQNAPRLAAAGPPTIGIFFILAGLLSAVGAVLLGIATIRAGIFSRSAAILLLIGLSWFGYTLFSDRRSPAAQSTSVGTESGARV